MVFVYLQHMEAGKYDNVIGADKKILSSAYADKIRLEGSRYSIIPQAGCQEKFLSSKADIVIFGGSRGGGKSYSLLMDAIKDVQNSSFNSIILRKEKDDLRDLVNTAYGLYSTFGDYNKSIQDMTWNFKYGSKLQFSYYSDQIEDFKVRFRGKQYAYIGIDEITHMGYQHFKFLLTCNRNAYYIRNRFYGTCNPDPDSWVRKFIDWWIDEEGFPIEDRDGVLRYCFMDGDTTDSIYWGSTREEVYEQAKDIIDSIWDPAYEVLGTPQEIFVKSVTFIEGRLKENMKLLMSDPNYLANLANQSEEDRARDLEGNWNFRRVGDDLIKLEDLIRLYENEPQTSGCMYATCDPAFSESANADNCVLWIWDGFHIKDIVVMRNDSKTVVERIQWYLRQHNVREENFSYDANGLGVALKGFFKRARPFLNDGIPTSGNRVQFSNIKSECAYHLINMLKDGLISINKDLLTRKFSGKGFKNATLDQVLNKERKAIQRDMHDTDKNWALIKKPMMKKILGSGRSPDFVESLLTRMIFHIQHKNTRPKGLWLI